jgi:hypothetical protein
VHHRTVARDGAPHQTFYLKIDRSLLNPHESADWVPSIEKATLFGSEREAQAVKGQREDTSGVLKDKDECYFYVMRVATLKASSESGQRSVLQRRLRERLDLSNQANSIGEAR